MLLAPALAHGWMPGTKPRHDNIAKSARLRNLAGMSARAPHILPYGGVSPSFATPPMHAGVGSAVLGRVTVGRNAWLGALSVMRADGHFVRVGDDFHLGARSTLHINHEIFPCIVGDRVSVGRNACVHACTVGSDVVVGDEVVILDGATVDDNVVLEPGATVFPNKTVPGGFVYAGSPAKPVRPLAAGEVAERRAKMARDHEAEVRDGAARRHRRGFADSSVGLHRQHGEREGPPDRRGGRRASGTATASMPAMPRSRSGRARTSRTTR